MRREREENVSDGEEKKEEFLLIGIEYVTEGVDTIMVVHVVIRGKSCEFMQAPIIGKVDPVRRSRLNQAAVDLVTQCLSESGDDMAPQFVGRGNGSGPSPASSGAPS